jgi:predicted phage terminase large subunit-like protein
VDEKFARWWAGKRQRARTDLLFLCNEVLGYKDVEAELHGPIIEKIQKFPGGVDKFNAQGLWTYEPHGEVWDLEGPRNQLFLYPRGTLKTSLITQAQAVQWIINFPDIRILIDCAISEQVHKVVTGIRTHFQFNEKFRFFFPEFCPSAKKASDWGNQEGFTTLARRDHTLRESTISSATVGRKIAGSHYEVIFHSDLVDENNVKTAAQMEEVINHFKYSDPLLDRNPKPPGYGWTIVEGTPYDFGDLHELIQKEERERIANNQQPQWSILVKGGKNEDGTALWPKRLPLAELERIRLKLGDFIYSCQYLCKPVPSSGSLATREQIKFIPRSALNAILPMLRLHVTVDLHGMEDKARHDYTVITLAGFDRDGRVYVLEAYRGHYTPFETIERIFLLYERYPQIFDFKIEKDAHARVLLPFLRREMGKRQRFPNIVPIPRSTTISKVQRIRGLQPWFAGDVIRFADDLGCRLELLEEILKFPSYPHDDILDTIADQMQNRDGLAVGDVMPNAPRAVPEAFRHPTFDRFMGFDPFTQQQNWFRDFASGENFYHKGTGL